MEKQARTVNVEATLDERLKPGELLVGYSADLEVVLDTRDNVLRIPTSALQEGNKVLVYDAKSKLLQERQIRAGLSNWEYTEVVEGLTEKDRIVVSLEREGVKAGVKAVPEQKPATK